MLHKKKVFLKMFAKLKKKTPLLESTVKKLKRCMTQAYNFIKNRLQYKCFPLNFAKFKSTFFAEHLQWLFLLLELIQLSTLFVLLF